METNICSFVKREIIVSYFCVKDQDWWEEVLCEIIKCWSRNKNTEDSYKEEETTGAQWVYMGLMWKYRCKMVRYLMKKNGVKLI